MIKKHKTFIVALVGLVLFLGAFIFWQERIVLVGSEVVLATRPVDPRDLFKGEYVILLYEIETHEMVVNTVRGMESGKNVYVKVVPDSEGIARVTEVSVTKPDFSTGTWLRGEVSGNNLRFSSLRQFYVPEGAGRPIERMRTDLRVKIRVFDGEARVVELLDKNLNPITPKDYIER